MNVAAVPVTDASPYRHGDAAGRLALAAEIDRTCREIGFMAISGHGVDPEPIAAVERVNRARLPEPEVRISPGQVHVICNRASGSRMLGGGFIRHFA